MIYKHLSKTKTRIVSGIIAATIAISTLPFFIGTDKVSAAVLSSNALVTTANTKAAGYKTEKAFRDAILAACKKMDGVKYQWGGGGWNGIDCAGSVSLAYSVALKTAKITGTSGSYGNKTLSYTGGGNPDKYGFYRPGFAGIKSTFTNALLKNRGISPKENKFSSFDTNGKKGIQNDEWVKIINKYGFKPGDMIMWWNDNNDKTNAQHITIYAGIENGVAKHWTASSTSGHFCKKSLASSTSEAGKGSFTGFMALKATAMVDNAFAGFTLDKRDPSGINYTGAVFSVYKDPELNTKAGELRDDNADGVYTDYYALSGSSYTRKKYQLTKSGNNYADTLYIRETKAPQGVILADGTKISLTDSEGNVPDVYNFADQNVYVVEISLTGIDGSKGKLDYSVKKTDGSVLYQTSVSGYAYTSGTDVILITNMITDDETAGRGKGAGLFTEASSLSLEKTTKTDFDVTTTVFTLSEGEKTVAVYKYAEGSWNWYDVNNTKWPGAFFPIKYSTEYTVTERFAKEVFSCIDGSTIDYEYSNDSGWTYIEDSAYQYTFKTEGPESKSTYSFAVENNRYSGTLQVLKNVADEDDTKDGFVFELWNKDKTKLLAKGVSDKDGRVLWETKTGNSLESFRLPTGVYVLAEIVPDRGYIDTSNAYTYKVPEGFEDGKDGKWYKEIRIGAEEVTESVTNDRTEVTLKVMKASEDGENKGVRFSVYYGGKDEEPSWQEKAIAEGKTDSNGVVVFKHLPTGWYRIDEDIKPVYKAVWDDGTTGRSRMIRLTEDDDNKTVQVKATNKIDIKPAISTELADGNMSHDVSCGKSIILTDKVHFENLISGYEYKITGSLIDKRTGEVFKDKEGNEYKTSATFIADETCGELAKDEQGRDVVFGDIEIKFNVDTALLYSLFYEQGESSLSVVCFETLTFRGIVIGEHKDIEDEKQTVKVSVKISTSASDSNTGSGILTYSDVVGINDKVSYDGLNPGESYVLTGMLMDKSTGNPYMDSEGNTYEAEKLFVPETSSGYVNVSFKDVKVPLDPVEVVVFETLRPEGYDKPIAEHKDIEDKDQTLKRPSCKTVATTVKGDKAFLNDSIVTLVDHVSYQNLEPGNTYYAKATLFLTDGTGVENNGTEVVSLQKFVPLEGNGMVDVTIKFDSTGLSAGDTVVIVENIYDMSTDEEKLMGIQTEDIRVVSHEDLNNKDQSLSVTDIPISGEVTSNETIAGLVVFFIATGAAAVAVVIEIRRKTMKRNYRR